MAIVSKTTRCAVCGSTDVTFSGGDQALSLRVLRRR